jgi:hypothetical protein
MKTIIVPNKSRMPVVWVRNEKNRFDNIKKVNSVRMQNVISVVNTLTPLTPFEF